MIRVIASASTALLAACQSMPKLTEIPSERPLSMDEPMALTGLMESGIPDGECGMVLWTLEEERPMPVMRYIADKVGEIAVNDRAYPLVRTKTGGANGYGIFETQSFSTEAKFTAHVTFEFGMGFDRGSYIERALISIETEEGWRFVTPAAGIAGCRY